MGGASGNGTPTQVVRRSIGVTWLCHSEGQSWGLSCLPNMDSNGALSIGGISALPQLRARITFASPPAVLSSTGAQTLTNANVAWSSTGQYTITFPTAVSTNTYGVLITARAITPYFMTYGGVTTTSFAVNVYNTAGTATTPASNSDFTIQTTI